MTDKITIERETLERAIDALQWHYDRGYPDQPTDEPRKRDARAIRTLRAALAQKAEPPAPAAVPPGMAPVPIEPTEAMLLAGQQASYTATTHRDWIPIYRAMIAAAGDKS